jgi:hypothetical protein
VAACGVWPARRGLVAALVGPAGRARKAIVVADTDDARAGLVAYLAAARLDLVLPAPALQADPLVGMATGDGVTVWLAPGALVEAIRRAAGIVTPAASAALLARLPAVPGLRVQLWRPVPVSADDRQLRLL